MKLGAKLGIAGGGLLAMIILMVFIMNISYQNSYERIDEDILAHYKKIESSYEKQSRIILQQAGILNKYSTDFKDIYKGMMQGRYGKDGSKAMMQWIKEQNPSIDASVYKKLMTTVEAQKTTFDRLQAQLTSMVAESNKMLKTAPSNWFVDGDMKEAKIVSSTATKVIVDSGIDDTSNDLFEKKD
jgi:hypothetical protein